MKLSNLALRMEAETEFEAADASADKATAEELARAALRQQRTRRLGLDYRAIVIQDDGLRLFRVR